MGSPRRGVLGYETAVVVMQVDMETRNKLCIIYNGAIGNRRIGQYLCIVSSASLLLSLLLICLNKDSFEYIVPLGYPRAAIEGFLSSI